MSSGASQVTPIEAMESLGTCRFYKKDPIPDTVLFEALSAARFAPQGGNRQPVRFVVVRDRETKLALKALYLPHWDAYYQGFEEGELKVARPQQMVNADHMARTMEDIPVLVVVCAEIEGLHPTDLELGRLSIVGGGSVYPAVQNLMLACRQLGLGTALTTLLCHSEPEVKALLGIPDGFLTAAMVTVGYPERPFPRKLARRPVSEVCFSEKFGEPFAPHLDHGVTP